MYGFISLQQAQGFATLWGIPYLYDFLLDRGIIKEQLHRKTIAIAEKLKVECLNKYENNWQLWRYDFVNRWQPDNNSNSTELAKQAQLFTDSFQLSEPLSDVPGEGKLESFFNKMAEKLGIDLEKIKNEEQQNVDDELEELDDEIEPIIPKKNQKNHKKSNLSLAAQLYNSDSIQKKKN